MKGIRPGPPRIPLDRVRRIFLENLVNKVKIKHKSYEERQEFKSLTATKHIGN